VSRERKLHAAQPHLRLGYLNAHAYRSAEQLQKRTKRTSGVCKVFLPTEGRVVVASRPMASAWLRFCFDPRPQFYAVAVGRALLERPRTKPYEHVYAYGFHLG
jgi:hypothetical protein